MSPRPSGRRADELRAVRITRGFTRHAEGSVLVAMGDTQVLCTVSVEEGVPSFLKGKGQGWLTAEYGMLPRATNTRMRREAAEGRQSGRTQEIQRLIGRSLRAVVDLTALGERTLKIDCDVLQADGGTRCASITGAYVAVADAIAWCKGAGLIVGEPLRDHVAAVSVGVVDGAAVLDLDYAEDASLRHRHERRDDRQRRLRRTAGHGRRRAVHARRKWMRWWRSRRTASRGSSRRRKRHCAVDLPSRPRLRQRGQAARVPPLAGAARHRGGPAGGTRIPEADEPHVTFVENALAKARHASAMAQAARARRRFGHLRGGARRRARRAIARAMRESRIGRAQQREADRGTCRRRRPPCALLLRPGAGPPCRRPGAADRRRRVARHDHRPAAGKRRLRLRPAFPGRATGLTGAELPLERKNELSHRGQAMRALLARLDAVRTWP